MKGGCKKIKGKDGKTKTGQDVISKRKKWRNDARKEGNKKKEGGKDKWAAGKFEI